MPTSRPRRAPAIRDPADRRGGARRRGPVCPLDHRAARTSGARPRPADLARLFRAQPVTGPARRTVADRDAGAGGTCAARGADAHRARAVPRAARHAAGARRTRPGAGADGTRGPHRSAGLPPLLRCEPPDRPWRPRLPRDGRQPRHRADLSRRASSAWRAAATGPRRRCPSARARRWAVRAAGGRPDRAVPRPRAVRGRRTPAAGPRADAPVVPDAHGHRGTPRPDRAAPGAGACRPVATGRLARAARGRRTPDPLGRDRAAAMVRDLHLPRALGLGRGLGPGRAVQALDAALLAGTPPTWPAACPRPSNTCRRRA
jgi:hypothetical protein